MLAGDDEVIAAARCASSYWKVQDPDGHAANEVSFDDIVMFWGCDMLEDVLKGGVRHVIYVYVMLWIVQA